MHHLHHLVMVRVMPKWFRLVKQRLLLALFLLHQEWSGRLLSLHQR
jgi:hypothetical protein